MNVTLELKRFNTHTHTNTSTHTKAHHKDAELKPLKIIKHIPLFQQTESKTLNKYRYQKQIHRSYLYSQKKKNEHQKLVDPHKKDKQNCY